MKIPHNRDAGSIELKMTPMIDVVFLLLVFFVWTSSFELPEFDLPGSIAMPPIGSIDTSSETPPEAFDEIILRLSRHDAELRIEMNGNLIRDQKTLTGKLTEIVTLGVQPPVIVDPADDVTMEWAVSVYDAARSAGIDRVLFAAAQ